MEIRSSQNHCQFLSFRFFSFIFYLKKKKKNIVMPRSKFSTSIQTTERMID